MSFGRVCSSQIFFLSVNIISEIFFFQILEPNLVFPFKDGIYYIFFLQNDQIKNNPVGI